MFGWTLVREVKLLKRARNGGYLTWVTVRGRGIIRRWCSIYCWYSCFLLDFLIWFKLPAHVIYSLIGAKNYSSELIPMSRTDHFEKIESELGCKEGKTPSYLGPALVAPSGLQHGMRWTRDFTKDAQRWKRKYNSQEGRFMLIKSNLSSSSCGRLTRERFWQLISSREENDSWYTDASNFQLKAKISFMFINWYV